MSISTEEEFDLSLEPEVLTDRTEVKTVPCRRCRRPCVVTRFASTTKTECLTCRDQGQVAALEFNDELETETLTETKDTKELPCRRCKRRCVVNRSASPAKVECNTCRKGGVAATLEFNDELETEVLTDKAETKELPCRKCGRRCVVNRFMALDATECNTCRGVKKQERREEVLTRKAPSIGNMADLEFLIDGIMNPALKHVPLCPFDPEHPVELKSVVHTPNYGPRRVVGYDKGFPKYDQETGESVVYQCNECRCVISFSTQHPLLMRQNEKAQRSTGIGSFLAAALGVRNEEAA